MMTAAINSAAPRPTPMPTPRGVEMLLLPPSCAALGPGVAVPLSDVEIDVGDSDVGIEEEPDVVVELELVD